MGLLFVVRPRDDDDRDDDVIIVQFADDNAVRCFFDGINTPKTPVYSIYGRPSDDCYFCDWSIG